MNSANQHSQRNTTDVHQPINHADTMRFLLGVDDSGSGDDLGLNWTLASENGNNLLPLIAASLLKQFDISKHEEALSGTRKCDTDTVGDFQEANVIDEVVADK